MAAATAPEAVAERAAEVAQGVAARAEVAVVADWAAVAAPVADWLEFAVDMSAVADWAVVAGSGSEVNCPPFN